MANRHREDHCFSNRPCYFVAIFDIMNEQPQLQTEGGKNMRFSKIHHIAIIGSDYDASKSFYVDKLGFSVIREHYREARNDWKIDLELAEGIELELFIEPDPPKRVTRPEACGLRHLAFEVESVEETVEKLLQIGIVCEPIRVDEYTNKKMTFFFDPDGLPLEIHE